MSELSATFGTDTEVAQALANIASNAVGDAHDVDLDKYQFQGLQMNPNGVNVTLLKKPPQAIEEVDVEEDDE